MERINPNNWDRYFVEGARRPMLRLVTGMILVQNWLEELKRLVPEK
jgi:hypothetical protein